MTLKELNAVMKTMRLGETAQEIARLVFVKGYKHADAAREVGVTRQAAGEVCRRIEREIKAVVGCPEGWRVVTVCVPPGEATTVKGIERAALKAAGLLV